MKDLYTLFIGVVLCSMFLSCSDEDSNESTHKDNCPNRDFSLDNQGAVNRKPINEFIYKGLNTYYLFRDDQCDFIKPNFKTDVGFVNFTGQGGSPEEFFETLTVEQDRFSWIVDDFEELEAQFAGESKQTGLSFLAFRESENNEDVYLVVTRVSKNSSADKEGVKRGDVFNRIDGAQLTLSNFNDIFDRESYTLGKAQFAGTNIVDIAEDVDLVKEKLTDGSVPVVRVINEGGIKIGYLFYSQFARQSELELNAVFGLLKNENIDELVLDLRYNGGGSIRTAVALSSMITGQFNDEVLVKQQWNSIVQEAIEKNNPENLITKFTSTIVDEKEEDDENDDEEIAINSLNLSKVYVLMTKRQTASASELVINGLKPYIDVVTIGDGSVGKSEGSITLYDSTNLFEKEGVNTSHKYAMQPLVLRSINKDDGIVPTDGLTPTINFREDITELGELGSLSDPFFKRAVDEITGNVSLAAKNLKTSSNISYKIIGSDQDPRDPLYQKMYQ